jgi:hypothetical protein
VPPAGGSQGTGQGLEWGNGGGGREALTSVPVELISR